MSVTPGRFIVIEGLEGAGKTTAIKTIKRMLTDLDIEFITTREPGGTHVGEMVRQIVKDTTVEESLDPRAELLLFYAARVQLLEHVIKPALQRGCWVLADRFELSSFAYQGGGRGLDMDMLYKLSSFCVQGCQPDMIVFLDVDPKLGLARALKRSKLDRMEQESLAFFKVVYDAYHAHIKKMSNVIRIDANHPLPVVQHLLRTKLSHVFATT